MPVVRSSSFGARTDGEGEEKDVRCGFCFKAAWSGARDDGGVIRVISTAIVREMSQHSLWLDHSPEIPDLRKKSMA